MAGSAVDPRVTLWRKLLNNNEKSWVLFEHGTCLVLMQPESDLTKQAREIMSTDGPVRVGSQMGDFSIQKLDEPFNGWIVAGHHPDMINYIAAEDDRLSDQAATDQSSFMVGILGRNDRDQDSQSLNIIHIEDNR
ncbi:hypothetical protein BGW36DRAFT_464706 [Talaromyces proteolyticus]|uniref:Uncharacterized protein n=1 Tax=Talaromyces proteolyticus TaxID=1131652 RepID=A0AAD4KJ00_9EURO|nr:uncharacterized protein BGW36DRAFT_464706 [Talaromyces proteolyticus]KAH8692154.1 hypothetical protein BGW36DRAFT_464706 [Talaromyces proteolyticus]